MRARLWRCSMQGLRIVRHILPNSKTKSCVLLHCSHLSMMKAGQGECAVGHSRQCYFDLATRLRRMFLTRTITRIRAYLERYRVHVWLLHRVLCSKMRAQQIATGTANFVVQRSVWYLPAAVSDGSGSPKNILVGSGIRASDVRWRALAFVVHLSDVDVGVKVVQG